MLGKVKATAMAMALDEDQYNVILATKRENNKHFVVSFLRLFVIKVGILMGGIDCSDASEAERAGETTLDAEGGGGGDFAGVTLGSETHLQSPSAFCKPFESSSAVTPSSMCSSETLNPLCPFLAILFQSSRR